MSAQRPGRYDYPQPRRFSDGCGFWLLALFTAAITALLLAVAACGSQPARTGGPGPTRVASEAASSNETPPPVESPPSPPLSVHDPGRVTYSAGKPAPGSCHARDGGQLPDPSPSCTPGAVDPAVDQANIAVTICKPGYTATVRPPSSQTNAAKFGVAYPAYGILAGTSAELDHLVSLELGGANDLANLWPEAYPVARAKDAVENALHKAVCAGKVTLVAAQTAIASNWTAAGQRLGVGS